MRKAVCFGIAVAVGAAGLGFFTGRECGRRDAFTRGVVQGYIESLENDLVVSSDGKGGVRLSAERVESYQQGMRQNAEHMRLDEYLRYYDVGLFANYPLSTKP